MIALRLPFIDDLSLLATTDYLEAEGEPWLGKLGVAFAIANRHERWQQSVSDIVFARFQFSAWNTESPRRLTIDTLDPVIYQDCYKAACAALFRLVPDPTFGADHYLQVETVLAQTGRLPSWAAAPSDPKRPDPTKVTAVIGAHTFLRLK